MAYIYTYQGPVVHLFGAYCVMGSDTYRCIFSLSAENPPISDFGHRPGLASDSGDQALGAAKGQSVHSPVARPVRSHPHPIGMTHGAVRMGVLKSGPCPPPAKPFILESSVEHTRVCVWRVGWQGRGVVALERVRIRPTPCGCATTRMAAPCKEEQRSRWRLDRLTNPAYPARVQRSQACNRVRSGFTQRVSATEGAILNIHGASRGKMSDQLRNQG